MMRRVSSTLVFTGHNQSFPTRCIDLSMVPGLPLYANFMKIFNCKKVVIFDAMTFVMGRS